MNRMVKPKKLKNIYVVEIWSNEMRPHPFCEGECHDVMTVHIASSLKKAKNFCHRHNDYGGTPNMDCYYPWHFRVRHQKLNEDQCCIVHNHSKVVYTYYPEPDECFGGI